MTLLPEARRLAWLFAIVLVGSAASLEAQDKPVVFKGALIETAVAPAIADGVLVVQNGKIVAVGAAGSVAIPADADVRDAAGMVIMPGVVDTHSHIGGIVNESSGPAQPDLRVLDAIDPRNGGFRRALAGGITTVNIMPGSGNVIGGQTIYLKLRRSVDIADLFIRDVDGRPTGGLKMANGTNPIGAAPYPTTRAKTAAIARTEFIKAREYAEKVAKAGDDSSKLPPRDLALESLAEVLAGKRVVHHHTHRQDDILTVLRLKEEFGFKLVLQHVTEARFVAEQIAKAGVPCSIIDVDSPGGKLETRDLDWNTGAVLEKAGVLVAFHTDDPVIDSRFLVRSAALAIRAGMSRDAALRALTINPAKILDLDSRIGSLEPGKDADFVVLDGDPFSVYTHVQETWVEGKRVFDLSNPEDHLYAVGGEGAGSRGPAQLCCFGELHEGGAQ
jgi:imidazolonepropionase-like amidohydrolase